MKAITFNKKVFFQQFGFSYLRLKYSKSETKIQALIRSKYNQSLVAKTFLIFNIFNNDLSVKRLKSNFFILTTNLDYNFRPSYIRFSNTFTSSSKLLNLIQIIKKNQLENVYDFFNWPVKFNLIKKQNLNSFILESVS